MGLGCVGHMVAKFASYFGYEVTVFSQEGEKQNILLENGVKIE